MFQARESKCKSELKEMSEKLTSQEDRVEQHVRTIEKLESEKADLAGSEFYQTLLIISTLCDLKIIHLILF